MPAAPSDTAENTEQTKEKDDPVNATIQTRSRRRKASAITTNSDQPVTSTSEPVKPDILLHHKEMESHITLLDQHSKEQRENLQQHQKLLEIERGKLQEMEEEKERQLGRMMDLEISYSTDKERLCERIRVLENALADKDHSLTQQAVNMTFLTSELEQERVSVRQLRSELEQEREANSHLRKVQSDLVRVRLALDEEKTVRNMREQQLKEKETSYHGLQGTLGEEQQVRLRLEEELRQARSACSELERRLENERLSSQSRREDIQAKDDTIAEQLRLLQLEREQKADLQERLRNMQIQMDQERNRRISIERELTEERLTLQQDRENLERERERYEQRIRDSERNAIESEHRLRELQSAVSSAQDTLAEYRRLEPRDWIIRRDEVTLSENSLGVGAWGKVYEGSFRGCKVAVKQIHELILSPHNRRLFEREMSIASRCRHPHLLQFIGATNDDGSPLFVTELLDTDLRNILTQRALHQEEIICLALDVSRGLNYLHLNKPFPIMHRDISSSNVLLWRRDNSWRAKLSDYGAANFMRQYMTENPGARIYAAPEALTSQQSPKADVYSFGLLLCEMCIRELPVPQQIHQQIGLVTNGVLRELIMRCVARDPEARPAISDVIAVLT
ncbi:probable serine/threonine-protein kinase DDB_G0271682, partial [Orbicella faveolata]